MKSIINMVRTLVISLLLSGVLFGLITAPAFAQTIINKEQTTPTLPIESVDKTVSETVPANGQDGKGQTTLTFPIESVEKTVSETVPANGQDGKGQTTLTLQVTLKLPIESVEKTVSETVPANGQDGKAQITITFPIESVEKTVSERVPTNVSGCYSDSSCRNLLNNKDAHNCKRSGGHYWEQSAGVPPCRRL